MINIKKNDVPGLPLFQSCFVTINNIGLHYIIGGCGPVIMLIHGWPYTWNEWKNILPDLAQAGYTVIAPDMRGCGDSGKSNHVYTKRDLAEDFYLLTEVLKIETLYLMGVDIGMMVAYAFAATYPSKVKKVILGEGVLPGFGLEEMMNPATGGSWHFGFQSNAEFAARVISGNEKIYYEYFWQMMSPVKGITEESVKPYLKFYANLEGSRGGFFHYTALANDSKFNKENPNRKLQMPVLIISGDKGIPQFLTINSIKQVADNYETALVENCGHTLAEENPEGTVKHILNFIQK